jgi:hypothetical protein
MRPRPDPLGPMGKGKEGPREKRTFEGAEVAVVRRLEEHAPLLAAGCSAARRRKGGAGSAGAELLVINRQV